MLTQFVMPKMGTQRRARLLALTIAASAIVILSSFAPFSLGASTAAEEPPATAAQPTVELGTAGSFSALASAALTSSGGSAAGAMDSSGTGTASNADMAKQAQDDLAAAYNSVAALTPTAIIAGDLGGLTITPGIYHSAAALAMTTSVTFDALGDPNAVFIFQVGAAVNTTAGSKMILVNGAQASRIYWQTVAAVTTGASSFFTGTILGNAAITAGAGTTLQGRALTMGGAVTLDGVALLPVPDISITSSVAPSVDIEAGDPVVFTNVIRNRGNVSLALSLATGLPASAVTTIAWPDAARLLPAGQSIVATTVYAPTLSDAAARSITPRASVTGTPVDFGAVSASSSVRLLVYPTPVADAATTSAGTPVSFNVLTNDAGAEIGGRFSRATLGTKRRLVGGATGPIPSSPASGSVTCIDSGLDRGLCTYQPAGLFTGTDFFDITLSQDTRSWNVRVSITITPAPAVPTPRNDRLVATQGGPAITFDPTANDTDSFPGILSIVSSTALPAGQGDLACSKTFCVYTPPSAGFTGTASATYSVSDNAGNGTAATADITIFVDVPVITSPGATASNSTGTAVTIGAWSNSTTVTAAASVCVAGRVSTAISWQPNTAATSWTLERRLTGSSPGPWIPLATLPAATTTYVDTQVGEGNAYEWQVRPDHHRWRGAFSLPSAARAQPAAVNAAGC